MIVGRGALGTITKRNFLGSKLLFAFHLREKKTLLAAEPQQGSNLVKKILLVIGSICKTFTNQLLLAGFESWLGFLQLFLGWTSLLLLELGVFAASNQAGPASSPPCQPWLCALPFSFRHFCPFPMDRISNPIFSTNSSSSASFPDILSFSWAFLLSSQLTPNLLHLFKKLASSLRYFLKTIFFFFF